MKCKIVSVTHKPSDWEKNALEFYSKQLPRNFNLAFAEVKPNASKSFSPDAILKAESIEILKHINNQSYVILWDRKGKSISSKSFAELLQSTINQAKDLILIIGGAFGSSEAIFNRSDIVLSASEFTFPHRLFKVLLVEQIFRATAINRNHPYHK